MSEVESLQMEAGNSTFSCPCCGSKTTAQLPIDALKEIEGGFVMDGIIEALIEAKGRGLSSEQMAYLVYQLRNDHPENAINSIKVAIHKLRKKLPYYGWTISSKGKGGKSVIALYKLSPIETRVGA